MRLCLVLFLCLAAVSPAWADKIPLQRISAYLNDLTTAKAEFTQINDDGTISTGTLLIRRPGRMRFEYAPPESTTVVAGAGTVVILDEKSNQPPESYPLNQTPLSIILARTVDLSRARMVTGHGFDGTATTVTAQDPENPDHGTIKMVFTDNPVELRQWVIEDGNGITTTVILGEMSRGVSIPTSKFDTGRYTARGN
jgi:outer membrane lipoprotein-sorting protein